METEYWCVQSKLIQSVFAGKLWQLTTIGKGHYLLFHVNENVSQKVNVFD